MMLGTVLATVKVSEVRCTPIAAANAALRTKPSAREAVVPTAITVLVRSRPPANCGLSDWALPDTPGTVSSPSAVDASLTRTLH